MHDTIHLHGQKTAPQPLTDPMPQAGYHISLEVLETLHIVQPGTSAHVSTVNPDRFIKPD